MRAQARRHEGTEARRKRPRHVAFTLIELLVVVVLAGLAASLVTLQLHGSTDRARLRAATIRLEQTLRLARHHAMTRYQPVWLVFRLSSARYRLAFNEQEQDDSGVWQTLDDVRVERAILRGQGACSAKHEEFTIRITPTGASLPWALELWTRSARRVVWTDGIGNRLSFVDDIGLGELRWDDVMEPAP